MLQKHWLREVLLWNAWASSLVKALVLHNALKHGTLWGKAKGLVLQNKPQIDLKSVFPPLQSIVSKLSSQNMAFTQATLQCDATTQQMTQLISPNSLQSVPPKLSGQTIVFTQATTLHCDDTIQQPHLKKSRVAVLYTQTSWFLNQFSFEYQGINPGINHSTNTQVDLPCCCITRDYFYFS